MGMQQMLLAAILTRLASADLNGGGAGAATITYSLTSGGNITATDGVGATDLGKWLANALPADYEVFCSASGLGGSFSGTTGSWINMASGASWSLSTPDGNYSEYNRTLTLELRKVGTTTVLATATVDMTLTGIM